MTLIDAEFDSFIKTVLRALFDYVEDVVFIGGCTNALYRFVSSAGNQKATKKVQAGVTAQQLRYLELLFIDPIWVDLNKIPGFNETGIPKSIRVCNHAAYVMQKILIRDQGRSTAKKRKDAYYIYEISVVFRDDFSDIKRWARAIFRQIHARWRNRFLKEITELFGSIGAEGCISAEKVFNEFNAESGTQITREMIFRSVEKLITAFQNSLKQKP